MNDTLTVNQKILVAAGNLVGRNVDPFTIEDLTVEAWKLDKPAFGLKGYRDQHPNSNVIYAAVMGERGLARKGWLDKVGEKLYTLTPAGRKEAGESKNGTVRRKALQAVQPGRDCEARVAKALFAPAMLRYRANQRQTVELGAALAFWGARHGDTAAVVNALRDVLARYVRECRDALVGGVCRFRSGQEVTERELAELVACDRWLGERFGRELERRAVKPVV